MAFASTSIQNTQRPLWQLGQQRGQILPDHRLTDFPLGGAVNITRKLLGNIVKIAILHGQRLR
ncbi:hypothetical protein D3C76_1634000 [compost metagenome]